jgi:type I restriction-modification system DNA methylase subunit
MNKQQLASKIWESANKMRSKIEANEYKDYILGFIFYKFLSDKEVKYLKGLGYTDDDLDTVTEEDDEIVLNVQKNIGYFISYKDLFSTWLDMGSDFNVEYPSFIYHQKPQVPLKITHKTNSQKTQTPKVSEPNSKDKEKQIIAGLKKIAMSFAHGTSDQYSQTIKLCNSLDGTSKWTRREMQLLNYAAKLINRNSAQGAKDVVSQIEDFAAKESKRSFNGEYICYEA